MHYFNYVLFLIIISWLVFIHLTHGLFSWGENGYFVNTLVSHLVKSSTSAKVFPNIFILFYFCSKFFNLRCMEKTVFYAFALYFYTFAFHVSIFLLMSVSMVIVNFTVFYSWNSSECVASRFWSLSCVMYCSLSQLRDTTCVVSRTWSFSEASCRFYDD